MAEARYLITLEDGTNLWLPESQYKKWESGELKLGGPLSPERAAELEEAEKVRMEQLRQMVIARNKK